MLLSIVYAIFRVVLEALVSGKHRDRDVELLVLRHQLMVLQRTAGRPRWQPGDRFVLAALSRQLPQPAWRSLLVTPETAVRWHRQLVRRKWAAFGRRGPLGRRPIPELIFNATEFEQRRMERETGIEPATSTLGRRATPFVFGMGLNRSFVLLTLVFWLPFRFPRSATS